ncbi:carbon-nitrogen hydrolase family protein [Temperatibacter marinus]|uniref:Carbon-nitrogen hydrolase family protein n=1 Tax=Temperatibacter marinus TaxID=1456591 RepID=A0AA52HAQ0_9PROT|nr:carbon-nitrogen hydrolase family protein [Temperatibacter marinus]WND02975.1 carbon-nitrogen hydrolase family protein [Temperatibacter marinus]
MTQMTIAGLQLDLAAGNNLDTVVSKIRKTMLRYPFIQMIVLSELAICGAGATTASPRLADCEERLCRLAKELDIWLVGGSLMEDLDGKIFNTTPVINPAGEVVDRYRKMYPFYPYEKGVSEGQDICVFDVPGYGKFGVYICYDMWFPELSRAMITEGAEVLLHPTLTDSCDRDVELAMVRATAAQQQCYFIDVNGTGEQGLGRSMMAGPDGDILYQSAGSEEVMLIEVDFDRVRRCRERGLMGLGQPLKSFRDASHSYPHEGMANRSKFLDNLGKLKVPART